jgi:hypothetical protein
MRELGEYVSMTALQKKTMAASLPRGMREYPEAWRDAWKIKDGPIVPLDVIRKYYMDKHIAFDEKYTSTYNSSKVSAGIGLNPDDKNWSDHDDQYTLKPFPVALCTREWGFDRHGVVKLTKEEKAALPGGKRPSSKKAKTLQVVVSDDEAEATDHFLWHEADEAEVRTAKHAKLTDAEFKQRIAIFSLKPRSKQDCAFVAIHRNKKYQDTHGGKVCPCRTVYVNGGANKTLDVPIDAWQRAWEKVILIYKQNSNKREATRMMHKLCDEYKEKWVQKGYAVGAQVDSVEATKKKKSSRFRRGKSTKKSTKAVAKAEEVAIWSVAKASSSSVTKTSDSEDSSSTDSEDSADDDEVEVSVKWAVRRMKTLRRRTGKSSNASWMMCSRVMTAVMKKPMRLT